MRVDLYLLADPAPQSTGLMVCRLLEKAYHRGHRIFVFCSNQTEAAWIDELLWTYKDDAFVPHHLQGEGPNPPPPIQIGHSTPHGFSDLLLNLAPTIPDFYIKFNRVLQVVGADEASKEIARAHYRTYRANGCNIHTHQL